MPRDRGAGWDFEDVRDHYVREFFGVGRPRPLADPERYLDLGRAAVAHVVMRGLQRVAPPGRRRAAAASSWARDLVPGAGWGLLDSTGAPKSTLLALGERLGPGGAASRTDEGLDGARRCTSSTTRPSRCDAHPRGHARRRGRPVRRDRGATTSPSRRTRRSAVSVDAVLGAFRDVLHAYRFGEPQYDAVHARLVVDGPSRADLVHLVGGQARGDERRPRARGRRRPDRGGWTLEMSTRDLAQWVSVDLDAHEPLDSWFHLAPGATRTIDLLGDPATTPTGVVRALNCARSAAVTGGAR